VWGFVGLEDVADRRWMSARLVSTTFFRAFSRFAELQVNQSPIHLNFIAACFDGLAKDHEQRTENHQGQDDSVAINHKVSDS
jgi:hypothetical protein